jgi:hypothetical protein
LPRTCAITMDVFDFSGIGHHASLWTATQIILTNQNDRPTWPNVLTSFGTVCKSVYLVVFDYVVVMFMTESIKIFIAHKNIRKGSHLNWVRVGFSTCTYKKFLF